VLLEENPQNLLWNSSARTICVRSLLFINLKENKEFLLLEAFLVEVYK